MSAAAKAIRPYPYAKRLIPAGEFLMGSKFALCGLGDLDERPSRRVFVSAYQIARTDTTVGQYTRFLEETAGIRHKAIIRGQVGSQEILSAPGEAKDVFASRILKLYCNGSITKMELLPEAVGKIPDFKWNKKGPDFPIVGLLHSEREAYCRYYGAWQITQAQYERAAKGPQGTDKNGTPIEQAVIHDNGYRSTASVEGPEAEHRVNGFDVMDLAGNVWKPTGRYDRRWYDLLKDGDKDPLRSFTDPETQLLEVRGGAWCFRSWHARAAYRTYGNDPVGRLDALGLRLALPPDSL